MDKCIKYVYSISCCYMKTKNIRTMLLYFIILYKTNSLFTLLFMFTFYV